MKVVFRFCLLAAFSLIVAAQTAYSCTCVYREHRDEIEKTDVIFSGRVVGITEDSNYVPAKIETAARRSGDKRDRRFLVRFKIETGFKGAGDGGEITLVQYQFEKPSPCGGLAFAEGKKYLVYAVKLSPGELSGGAACARTQVFDKKSEDYRELRQMRRKAANGRISREFQTIPVVSSLTTFCSVSGS